MIIKFGFLLTTTLFSLTCLQCMAQFTANSTASQVSCNFHELTSGAANDSASVWNNNLINLGNNFDFTFQVFFGCNDGGADGLAFVLQKAGDSTGAIGTSGSGLGYQGITPSLAVQFDTYQNIADGDPLNDHAALLKNGSVDHNSADQYYLLGFGEPGGVDTTLGPGESVINIEDCNWHTLRIEWTYGVINQLLKVSLDGSALWSLGSDYITEAFADDSIVLWGFTAGTGGVTNQQMFRTLLIPSFTTSSDSICLGNPITFTDASTSSLGTITNRNWKFTANDSSALSSDVFTYSPAGTYSVTLTVKDTSGCDTLLIKPVTVNDTPSVTLTPIDALCFGVCDGKVATTPTGGAPPYTYQWNDIAAQTTDTAKNLCVGSYGVTVTDTKGCKVVSSSATVGEPTKVVPSASVISNAVCNGDCNGSATAIASGGKGGTYSFNWLDPASQTTATATGLCGITYSVVAIDSNSCRDTTQVTITEPTAVIPSITSTTNANCKDSCTGSVTASATGGTGSNYTYLWNDPFSQITPTVTGLCVGAFIVTITDSLSCDTTINATITEPTLFTAFITSISNPKCFDSCNGTATVDTTGGGSGSVTYLWSDGLAQTTKTATGFCGGSYIVTVTNSLGCKDTANVSVTTPPPLIATPSTTPPTCNGVCDATATATATGGTGSVTYTWNDINAQTTATASGLCAQSYIVVIKDSTGCDTTYTINVTGPAPLSVTPVITNIKCTGNCDGAATASVSGGTSQFSYLWTDPNSQTATTATGLCKNSYNVTVTDANSCTTSATGTVTEPVKLAISLQPKTDVKCNGGNDGEANVTATPGTGTPPYTYQWTPSGGTNSKATGLAAGDYRATVTDANGCQADTLATITEPLKLSTSIAKKDITCGVFVGEATVTIYYGYGAKTILWSTGSTDTTIKDLAKGSYFVTVTDGNGCIKNDTVTIDIIPCNIVIPNAITPNEDGFNDKWEIQYLSFYPETKVELYNRWGDLVFTSTGYQTPWDGNALSGSELPAGVYYYVITVKSISFEKAGAVSLIR